MFLKSPSLLTRLRRVLRAPPGPGPAVSSASAVTEDRAARDEASSRWGDIFRVQATTLHLLAKRVTPDQLFRHVVEGARGSLGADDASLMLLEGDELRVVAAGAGDDRPALRGEPVRLGEGVAGWVARTGTPVLLNEGDDLSRFPNLVEKSGCIRSALSVPLEVESRVVGVLNANRVRAEAAPFGAEDLAVLRLFGGTAALAVDQTTVLRRTQARTRALDTLLGITEAFADGAEPRKALLTLMPRLAQAFHPSIALACLGSAEEARLPAVAAWTPRTGPLDGGRLGESALIIDEAVTRLFAGREPAWLDGLDFERQGLDGDALGAWPARGLAVPAAEANSPVRALIVLRWDEPDVPLTADDLRVLDGLARQVELALSRQDRAAAAGLLEAEVAQARAHLVEVERLATVGQSMAGLVHDINAPLTALITIAQLVQKDSAEPPSRERASQMVEAARRAQRLVREVLTRVRPQPPSFEPVDLASLLKAAMDLERAQCAVSGIKLVADFAEHLPRPMADPHRLGQVFLNLLVNARQAMDAAEKGTTITVRTAPGVRGVEIRFEDDGPGIPPALKARIFDWFFTTKPPGEGTGLGLAVSREILLAHGGDLRLEDSPAGGATFVLELPDIGGVADHPPEAPTGFGAAAKPPPGTWAPGRQA